MRTLIFCFLFPVLLKSQVWVQLPDFPSTKRDDGIAVVVNNKAYFGTGLQEWNATIDFRVLNLATNTWSTISNLPNTTERQYACAFSGSDCFYVFGGDGLGGALNTLYKYSVNSDTWTLMSPKPGNGLIAACCFNFGDKIIFTGGKFQDGTTNSEVWEYTVSTDTWAQKNNFPYTAVRRASAAVLNNKGYMLFGIDGNNMFHNELYRYDPQSDTWVSLINFPLSPGRAYAAMQAINNRLFVFGGIDSQNIFFNDSWYFVPESFSWIPGPGLPSKGRKGGMSCATGNDFYYACGVDEDGRLTETWRTDVPLGLAENKIINDFSVYPNPCKESLTITFLKTNEIFPVSAELINSLGEEVPSEFINKEDTLKLSTTGLPAGIYILRIFSGNKTSTTKFIRE